MAKEGISSYIPTLDGWRAVAIVAVMASHSQQILEDREGVAGQAVLHFLGLGVDLFFAISGFLITRLLVEECNRSGTFDLKGFYIRRVFRILPLIVVYLSVLAVATLCAPGLAERWEFVATLLFARNYLMHRTGGWGATGQFWSLSVEEHFYLFWPPILVLLGKKKALRAALVLVACITLWRAVDTRAHIFARFFTDAGVFFRSDTRCDALLLGAIPALLWDKTQSLVAWFRSFPITSLILVLLVVAVAERVPALPTVLTLLFSFLTISTVFRPSSAAGALLEARPMRWVGRLSYSLYVWQNLFLQVRPISFSWRAIGSSRGHVFFAYALDLGLIFGCALLTNRLVEEPMRRKGRELARLRAETRPLRPAH